VEQTISEMTLSGSQREREFPRRFFVALNKRDGPKLLLPLAQRCWGRDNLRSCIGCLWWLRRTGWAADRPVRNPQHPTSSRLAWHAVAATVQRI